jgi:hypothetical protein
MDDLRDEYHPHFGERPKSTGVPLGLSIVVAIGVIMIFAIGAGVVLNSGWGHHWPAIQTLRVPLK